jgi:hypothetical protein
MSLLTLQNAHARTHTRTDTNAHTLTSQHGATGDADTMTLPSSARAEMTALLKVDTSCTAPSLIPTVNGDKVRSFSTHGKQPAAKGSSTTVSRFDIRLIQYLDSSAHGWVRRWLSGHV